MNFPATPAEPVEVPPALRAALGVNLKQVGKSQFDYLVELDSEQIVRGLQLDFDLLKRLEARGVVVTSAAASPGYDFVSRFFAPGVGVDEDPVTGSAHCCLGPYWSKQLGRDTLVGYQASDHGGLVRVRLAGDRAVIGGRAVTVLRGELLAG